MPQASDELRSRMEERFGDSISDAGPTKFLEDAGYKLTSSWLWEPKKGVESLKDMTQEEYECILFLVHEWDYGGLSTGLVKGPTDSKVGSKNRRDGRKWGRRSGDRYAQEVISVLNRMRESGEVQGNLRYLGSSRYIFENGIDKWGKT